MKSVKFISQLASMIMISLFILSAFFAAKAPAAEEGGYASVSAVHYTTFSAMKAKDYQALADIVHPVKGARFSLNGRVNPKTDIVLKKTQLKGKSIGKQKFKWGTELGSGEDIVLTLDQFMERFNRDFENPDKSGHNRRVTTAGVSDPEGNSIRVIEGGEKVYENPVFEESFFRGKSGLEFDWDSFVMIFEAYKGDYFLVGVVHNYWLI